MLKTDNLTKIYNQGKDSQVIALDNVSIEIAKGSGVALMGVSGSGKSTLLNILGCLDIMTSGEYYIDGVNVSKMPPGELAAIRSEKFGFVLQENALLVKDSVYENVRLPLIFSKKYKLKEHKQRVLAVLKLLGIDNLSKRKVTTLSGGQKQRVAIARAMVNDPEVIFADEPTSALDSKTSKEIMDILTALISAGKTMIIVTHDINVATYMHNIYNIKDGKLFK